MHFERVSEEAEAVLFDILEHQNESDYWKNRFEGLSTKEDVILRGSFKELNDRELIVSKYADNYPYMIQVLKDGYTYEKHMLDQLSPFEKKLRELLKRSKTINNPINAAVGNISIHDYNLPAEEWMNDVKIFADRYLEKHPLRHRMETLIIHREFKELVACLRSISNDEEFIGEMRDRRVEDKTMNNTNALEYDVFLSHANKDKPDIVDDLYRSLEKLGVKIFYDKKEIEWGDDWKERILNGTEKSEFAIIVISENFFDREWTERELNTFLNKQNEKGQKIVLPILHKITTEQLKNKYPKVAEIQGISTKDYTCDQISILFARQLIKRLKSQ